MTKEAISALASLVAMTGTKAIIEQGSGPEYLDKWINTYPQLKDLDGQDVSAAREALSHTTVADVGKALNEYKKRRYPTRLPWLRTGKGGGPG